MTSTRIGFVAILFIALSACTGIPRGLSAVENFELSRYLGKWYEIARLDHSFERGLTDVSAHYRLQDDGSVEVVNRGYDISEQAWQEATGRAVFLDEPSVGSLKVSFFRPFYGGYHVIALDKDAYRWAMVAGPSREYLWILARDRSLSDQVLQSLVSQAREAGFDVDGLIWVSHEREDPASPGS